MGTVKVSHQISCGNIFRNCALITHGSVQEDAKLGDVVNLGQLVDLQDDLQDVVVNFFVAFDL